MRIIERLIALTLFVALGVYPSTASVLKGTVYSSEDDSPLSIVILDAAVRAM